MAFKDNFEDSSKAMVIRSTSVGIEWGSNNKRFKGMTLEQIKADIKTWYRTRKSEVYKSTMRQLLAADDLTLVRNH